MTHPTRMMDGPLPEEENKISLKISFDQSVSSGIIAFHATYETDLIPTTTPTVLLDMLRNQETLFRSKGYRVASDIEPKEKKESSEKK